MKRLLPSITFFLLVPLLFLGATVGLAQSQTFCPPGQQPHFSYGFAFLKSLLGQVMGEPLECERYDAAGNAAQRTTTGRAFYDKESNTPMFSAGRQHWAWTPSGLKKWADAPGSPATVVTAPLTTPLTLRLMSYNVLFGAGADPVWEQRAARLSPFSYPGNRLPQILAVIKAAQPDILAIQEAAGWDGGSPPIAQQVAGELGLNYFLAPTANGLHLALYTRFQIVAAENLSERLGNVGALRATLVTPDEEFLYVFVVHLDPFASTTRVAELAILTQEMSPYLASPTILLGDTNVTCLADREHCREYQALHQAGWRLALAGQYMIDQIWTSPPLAGPVEEITFPAGLFAISDHYPIGAAVSIYPTR